jgi:hypothetical protein
VAVAIEIRFGETPITVTGLGSAPDEYILDLGLQFASLTLVVKLLGIVAAGADPSMTIQMETALDPGEDEWISLGNFDPVATSGERTKRDFTGLLRYVRWKVDKLDDASSATFLLYGVAR